LAIADLLKQNWYNSAITLCVEISAASIVIQYWHGADHINVAAWISLLIVLVICLNIFAVQIYGEAEFIFASVKILTIVGLLIMAFIVDLGGGPKHDRLGFRFWKNPGAMKEYDSTGDTGRFLGLFSVLVNAAFSYGGVELVAVAAGEAENPRKVSFPRYLHPLKSLEIFSRGSAYLVVEHPQGSSQSLLAYPVFLRSRLPCNWCSRRFK